MAVSVSELPEVLAAELPEEHWSDRLLTSVAGAVDGALLQAMRLVVDAVMMPRPAELKLVREAAAPFLSGELWDEPRRFFAFVDEPVTPTTVTGRYRRPLDGGVVIAREFATAYRPYHARHNGDDTRAADRLLVDHWMHEQGRPLATVIALHGFSMGYPRLDAFALFATQCFRAGLDVALVTLPFHGTRTPPDARFSGERFAVPHVAHLNEAVRQAIFEIHLLVGWLRRLTAAPVGLLGLSLGGYLSSLMAGLTSDVDFVIPMVPPVCIGDLAWRFFSHSRRYRGTGSSAFSREELRAAYRVHSPLTYSRRVDKSRILILAGRGDQIVPPEHPHTLWCHWNEPDIYWFSGGHLAPFRRARLATTVVEHVLRCARSAR